MCRCQPVWPPGGKRHSVTMTRSFSSWTVGLASGRSLAALVTQILVAIAETYFFGQLGTEALAGFALVYPLMMLMQMMASGGMGGGVASAMARAVGGKRMEDARALVLHALVLGLAFAMLFMLFAWTLAPALFRMLGGHGLALAN